MATRTIRHKRTMPAWAKWYARDQDGSMWVFSEEPKIVRGGTWWSHKGLYDRVEKCPLDWRTSKRRIVGKKGKR